MLLRCRNTTNHLRKRRHLHNTVLRATIICRKCQKAPREPKKNEFRIAHAQKRENRFCTVAPLTCNPFNPNWISRHLEGTASCTRKSRSRGGYRRKRSFVSVLLSVGVGVVSRVYARSVFAHSSETWQSRSLVNGLQLCEAVRSYNETHVTYSSLKTSSR